MAEKLRPEVRRLAAESRPRRASAELPEPRRMLGWVYVARLVVLALLLLRGSTGVEARPNLVLLGSVLLAVTLLFSAGSYWYSHRLKRPVTTAFAFGQSAFDVALLSTIVFLTGGGASIFSPLYILVICTAALFLPFIPSLAVGALAIGLYFGIVFGTSDLNEGAVLLQIALFAVVALVTSYLGDRLRRTGTALGEVETELRQLRLDTGDILSTINTGILTVDGEGKLVYINPAAEEILDLRASEAIGEPVLKALDRIAPGLGGIILRTASTRTPVRRYETESVSDEAFVLGVSTTLVERGGTDGRPAVTAIFQDITQKMRLEALRRRAERLEAVAELSASLAHEIKNPLASIRSAVEQIRSGELDDADRHLLGDLVVRESDRLSRLLTEFIDFARVKVTAPEPTDFASTVRQVVDLVRAHPDARGKELHLRLDGDPAAMTIRGAEDLLHRAVLNLVLNAVQWAGERGRVDLTLDEVRSDLLSPSLGALSLVRLTVSDTGPGIPEEIVEHIFNPFFTRRPGGTGLGLALVQRAVEAHGGAIFVDNAPEGSDGGATFSLYLPAIPFDVGDSAAITSSEETTRP